VLHLSETFVDRIVSKDMLSKIGFHEEEIIDKIIQTGLTEGKLMKFVDEFRMIDEDGSGEIDFEEMKELLKKMWSAYPEYADGNADINDEDVWKRMKKFDANSDGKVSQGEYLRYMILHG